MPIKTRASLTAKFNICEGGTLRTAQTLERLGLQFDSVVTMGLILREMGLSDCVFSFCAVEKEDRAEADRVVRQYLMHVVGLAMRFLTITDPTLTDKLVEANKAINKRCEGHQRPGQLARAYAMVNDIYRNEPLTQLKYWLDVYRCALSDKPDYLAATHAGVALMDGAETVGIRPEIHAQLTKVLGELLHERICECGEPWTAGIVHRIDGPCYQRTAGGSGTNSPDAG